MAAPRPAITFFGLESKEGLSFGLMSLAAVLRRRGLPHRLVLGRTVEEAAARFAEAPTPLAGFSVTTGLHRLFAGWARTLKRRFEVHCVFGGPHPTFFPEFLSTQGVDAICLGEGEESLPDYLEAFGEAMSPPGTPVLGWRHKRVRRGVVEILDGGDRLPVTDLDALPSPDWSLYYDRNPWLARHPVKSFLATRGCPYRCTYCFNREWLDRSRGWGVPVVRTRSPELVVREIEDVRRRWPLRLVWFLDANFAANRRWLGEFLPLYRERIGLPFFCKV